MRWKQVPTTWSVSLSGQLESRVPHRQGPRAPPAPNLLVQRGTWACYCFWNDSLHAWMKKHLGLRSNVGTVFRDPGPGSQTRGCEASAFLAHWMV